MFLGLIQVKGVNLLSLRARDVYAYSLINLFLKEEMARSLVKKTARSEKPGLDEERVHLIESKSMVLGNQPYASLSGEEVRVWEGGASPNEPEVPRLKERTVKRNSV